MEGIEILLAGQPAISVPTINLHGAADGVGPVEAVDRDVGRFTGRYERRIVPGAGHFLPWEAPEALVGALRDLALG